MFQFQTYSIVAGTPYCNASCFFCVSKMTTNINTVSELSNKADVDWRNFHKATTLAQLGGVTTVLITGKGEPTMYPQEITDYLGNLKPYNFPLIELQTNGTLFQHHLYQKEDHLKKWYDHGLNTVILSIVSLDPEQNRKMYLPNKKEYPSLEKTIDILHQNGFGVRLGVVALKNHIDTPKKIEDLITYAKKYGIEQLKWTPVTESENSVAPQVNELIKGVELSEEEKREVHKYVEREGTHLMSLIHGANVYDLHGQNICISNCLTRDPENDTIRQLIFFSNGEVRYDWQYPGAVILGKGKNARQKEITQIKEGK